MEVTPEKPVAETSRGSRHTPTPKMSERKRALFGRCNTTSLCLSIDEDSDLGPMSPIRYSPVGDESSAADERSFRSLLLTKPVTPDDEVSNMSSVISDQAPIFSALPTAEAEETKENRPEESMKTPEVDKQSYCRDLRMSFKKSLILGDIGIPQVLVNKSSRKWLAKWNSDEESPNEKQPQKAEELVKAKTSLSFEMPAIAPVRFYGSGASKAEKRVVHAKNVASTSRRYSRGPKKVGLINKGVSHKITKPTRKSIFRALALKAKLVEKKEVKSDISTSQIQRLNSILRNAKNPLDMARPLRLQEESSSDEEAAEEEEEDEEEEEEIQPKKFFKSGTKRSKKRLTLIHALSATVDRGRVALVPPKKRKKVAKEAFDDLEDSFCDEQELKGIINKLTTEEEKEVDEIIAKVQSDPHDMFRKRLPYRTTDQEMIERQESILDLLISKGICTEETFKIFISEPEAHKEAAAKILDEMFVLTTEPVEEGVFPIFKRDFRAPEVASAKARQMRRLWKPIGAGQMQIDAGQREFGAKLCGECNLVYSVHEPEEEKLHWDFHSALNHINFRGWQTENVVLTVASWGAEGRVICVQSTDSQAKVNRVQRLLEVVDKELGACPRVLHAKAITYIAVAHQQIMGVCVAEPITTANRLVQRNDVDYFSEERFGAHCGILRLWTALPFRGQGVARQLLAAVQMHFVFGHVLTLDEIAFSSPTDAGKTFAQKLSGRSDILVYP
ncbi:N-acetyltransferase eco [Phlebotomus argentipes]|uniref:N-acetyltransferase eco n=1 Tax=Phlebotomus argentipes TaxID=94469 RepID=UPI0028931F86|nr:N-acetyltransferase eco [Phlebotomus argentipes]